MDVKWVNYGGYMEELYYVQDYRSYVGNDILWWSISGGYTCDITNAEVFTKTAAIALNKSRHTDIPWPKKYIDERTKIVVDMQNVKRDDWLKDSGIILRKTPKKKREIFKCFACGRFVSEREYYHTCYHGEPCNRCEDLY